MISELKREALYGIIAKGIKTENSRYLKGEYKEASKGQMMEPLEGKITEKEIEVLTDLMKSWNK